MRSVLQESQLEYQKLYDICVQECEKLAKMNEMWKKERKLREERENQIVDMGEELQMLRNQNSHLEQQLQSSREEKEKEVEIIKETVIEQ